MFYRKIRFSLLIGAGGLIALLSFARLTHAETAIFDGYLSSNTVWDSAHSPYIIEDQVFVPTGISLKIEPGTTIIASSSLMGLGAIYVQGDLVVGDYGPAPVRFSGDSNIIIAHGKAKIINGEIGFSYGLNIFNSLVNISSSTLSRSNQSMRIRSSIVSIFDSDITDNKYGIYVENPDPSQIFPVFLNDKYYFGGDGGFVSGNDISSTTLTISNSNIYNNSNYSIKNDDNNLVLASQNWWGDKDGPNTNSTNKIIGNVQYSPWLDGIAHKKIVCCSNIVFIPGLEASRLYSIDSKNTLWEPNTNADVKKLFLDQNGNGLNPIKVGQIISSAYSIKDIYGNFIQYLDSLRNSKQINNWSTYSYDWRKSVNAVAGQKENRLDEYAFDLADTIINNASSSKTGKVTVIAHSNGGLVMKYALQMLKDKGYDYLIDKAIGVAVPYVGTPSAIAGLLHGDGQAIAGGIFLNKLTSRNLGINMPSAYSLLPSSQYFSTLFEPSIAFASTTIIGLNNANYSEKIKNFSDQKAFILDSENQRKINHKDSNVPLKGNSKLYDMAETVHNFLDSIYWGNAINYWSIVGWNKLTTKTIQYLKKDCKNCEGYTYQNQKTNLGDGTVVSGSADFDSKNTVYIDLDKASDNEDRNIEHSNILGATSTINVIDQLVKNSNSDTAKQVAKQSDVIQFEKPQQFSSKSYLVVSTHSPVDLHVYDSKGRHSGISNKLQSLNLEDGLVTLVDQDIVNSLVETKDGEDGSFETYVYLPFKESAKYDVTIDGNNFGYFTYKVEKIIDDKKVDSVTYSNVPVTPLSVASTTIILTGSKFEDQVSNINLDFDGDGKTDNFVDKVTKFDDYQYIIMLKKLIDKKCITKDKCKLLNERLNKIKDKLDRNPKVGIGLRHKILEDIGHIDGSKIDSKRKLFVMDKIGKYLEQFID